VSGAMNSWTTPGELRMRKSGTDTWVIYLSGVSDGQEYKFYINSAYAPNTGWEGIVGLGDTGNRQLLVAQTDTILPVVLFNNEPIIIPIPKNLTADPGNGLVNLSWNKVNDPELALYRIYRGETAWNINLFDSVVASSPPDTFYVDNSVQNDTTYYYYVTAVDSAGNASGNSDTVNVTPSASITVELLVNANSTSSWGQDQGYPLNTYYHDAKHQSLYHAADLSNAGLTPGATITAVELYPSQSPGMDLQAFRVATAWTPVNSLVDSFITTTVGYGPTYQYQADFPMGTWVRFPIAPIIWDGNDNLVVEFYHIVP